jgi:hypothetical protein
LRSEHRRFKRSHVAYTHRSAELGNKALVDRKNFRNRRINRHRMPSIEPNGGVTQDAAG